MIPSAGWFLCNHSRHASTSTTAVQHIVSRERTFLWRCTICPRVSSPPLARLATTPAAGCEGVAVCFVPPTLASAPGAAVAVAASPDIATGASDEAACGASTAYRAVVASRDTSFGGLEEAVCGAGVVLAASASGPARLVAAAALTNPFLPPPLLPISPEGGSRCSKESEVLFSYSRSTISQSL